MSHFFIQLNAPCGGGHFKSHQDTPKASNHIGTLLIGIPSPFSGGQLVLRHKEDIATVDWSAEDWIDCEFIPWSFHYADVEHEILTVSSGHRLTIAYDIFTTEAISYQLPTALQPIEAESTSLYARLQKTLRTPEFLSNGGRMAFTLSYKYPAERMQRVLDTYFDRILKGGLMSHLGAQSRLLLIRK